MAKATNHEASCRRIAKNSSLAADLCQGLEVLPASAVLAAAGDGRAAADPEEEIAGAETAGIVLILEGAARTAAIGLKTAPDPARLLDKTAPRTPQSRQGPQVPPAVAAATAAPGPETAAATETGHPWVGIPYPRHALTTPLPALASVPPHQNPLLAAVSVNLLAVVSAIRSDIQWEVLASRRPIS